MTIYLLFCSYYSWSKANPWELAPLNFRIPSSGPAAAAEEAGPALQHDMRDESRKGRRTQRPGSSLRRQTRVVAAAATSGTKLALARQ